MGYVGNKLLLGPLCDVLACHVFYKDHLSYGGPLARCQLGQVHLEELPRRTIGKARLDGIDACRGFCNLIATNKLHDLLLLKDVIHRSVKNPLTFVINEFQHVVIYVSDVILEVGYDDTEVD